MKKLLIDAIAATDATKRTFNLTNDDFLGKPIIRGINIGAGDVVTLWVMVAGVWLDTGLKLDQNTSEVVLESIGSYAVSAVLTLTGPVSVEVESSGKL